MKNKIDKSKWTGEQLFEYYSTLGGEYEQTLSTARMQIGDELMPMLEECERTGKKITLVDDISIGKNLDDQPFFVKII